MRFFFLFQIEIYHVVSRFHEFFRLFLGILKKHGDYDAGGELEEGGKGNPCCFLGGNLSALRMKK